MESLEDASGALTISLSKVVIDESRFLKPKGDNQKKRLEPEKPIQTIKRKQ